MEKSCGRYRQRSTDQRAGVSALKQNHGEGQPSVTPDEKRVHHRVARAARCQGVTGDLRVAAAS